MDLVIFAFAKDVKWSYNKQVASRGRPQNSDCEPWKLNRAGSYKFIWVILDDNIYFSQFLTGWEILSSR